MFPEEDSPFTVHCVFCKVSVSSFLYREKQIWGEVTSPVGGLTSQCSFHSALCSGAQPVPFSGTAVSDVDGGQSAGGDGPVELGRACSWVRVASALPAVRAFSFSEGCMLCLGQSTFLRFNHPAEAKWMKSMIPAGGRAPGPPYNPSSGRAGGWEGGTPLDGPPPGRVRAGQHPWSGLAATCMATGRDPWLEQGVRCLGSQRLPGSLYPALTLASPCPSLRCWGQWFQSLRLAEQGRGRAGQVGSHWCGCLGSSEG